MARTQRISAFRPKLLSLAVASCFATSTALANPTGPTVVNGQVSILQNGSLLQITNSPSSIINWQRFSIGASEITRFIQQSQASAVLNRVTGSAGAIDPSVILGALQSNGRVFLVNPSGILFGAGAQVDVAGLVATSLNLSNADFLAGKLKFSEAPGAGAVVNQGNITTGPGGQVYLVGPAVTNSGIITSPNGEVVLAAGNSVELVNPGTPNLRVEITAPDNEARNLGQIVVDAGRAGIYAGLVNNSGTIRADSVVSEGGKILLKATKSATLDTGSVTSANGTTGGSVTVQAGDTTLVSGAVEAKGAEGKGGDVQVLGNLVGLTGNASVNASGDTGGGTVLVGGDFQGRSPDVQNAFRTYVGPDATIKADAISTGDGGKVIVWSDDATRAYGNISARGGARSGNGGFVEVSGHNWLDFAARVNTSAPNGLSGTLLLDPADVEIITGATSPTGSGNPYIFDNPLATSQIGWNDIALALNEGDTDVIVTTAGAFTAPLSGSITVIDASPDLATNHQLQLVAHNNINVNESITNTTSGGNVALYAGWDGISLPATPTVTAGIGQINLNAPITLNATNSQVRLESGWAIVQAPGAPITANKLLARSLGSFVGLDFAPNKVNILAGGAKGEFRFNNAQTLEIGLVGGTEGITVQSLSPFTNDASVVVTVTGGDLNVNKWIRAEAGSSNTATIALTAASGNINVIAPPPCDCNPMLIEAKGNSGDSGGPAIVTLDAGGSILVDGATIRAQGGDGSNGGDATVTLRAPGGITVQNGSGIEALGGRALSNFGSGGAAAIELCAGSFVLGVCAPSASGGITVNNSYLFARGGDATSGSNTLAGHALVRLTAGSGGIQVAGTSTVPYPFGNSSSSTTGTLLAQGGNIGCCNSFNSGGNATVLLDSTGGITVDNAIIAARGGSFVEVGRTGDALVALRSPGAISITGDGSNDTIAAYGRRGIVRIAGTDGGEVIWDAPANAAASITLTSAGIRANADGAEGHVHLLATGAIGATTSVISAGAVGLGDAQVHMNSFSGPVSLGGSTVDATDNNGLIPALVNVTAGTGGISLDGTTMYSLNTSSGGAQMMLSTDGNVTLTGGSEIFSKTDNNSYAITGINAAGNISSTSSIVSARSNYFNPISGVVGLRAGGDIILTGGQIDAQGMGGPTLVGLHAGNNIQLDGTLLSSGGAGASGWFVGFAPAELPAGIPDTFTGIGLNAGNRIVGGTGPLFSSSSYALQAMNGIGTPMAPVKIGNNDLSLITAHNTGTGDIALTFGFCCGVTINAGDLSGILNSNPTGTYFIQADGGEGLNLNAAFMPGGSNPGAGQTVHLKTTTSFVNLALSGTGSIAGAGQVTLESAGGGTGGIILAPGSSINGAGIVMLKADNMDIEGMVTGSTFTRIVPYTLPREIRLGAAGLANAVAPGQLLLNNAELNNITGYLRIESGANSNIVFEGPVSRTMGFLGLYGQTITQMTGATVAANLIVNTLGGTTLIDPANAIANFSTDMSNAGGVNLVTGGVLGVGIVNAAAGNAVSLTSSGNLLTSDGKDISAGTVELKTTGAGSNIVLGDSQISALDTGLSSTTPALTIQTMAGTGGDVISGANLSAASGALNVSGRNVQLDAGGVGRTVTNTDGDITITAGQSLSALNTSNGSYVDFTGKSVALQAGTFVYLGNAAGKGNVHTTGGPISITAGTSFGGCNPSDTAVCYSGNLLADTGNIAVTTTGGFFSTHGNVAATAGNVAVTSGGNIFTNTVSASGTLSLASSTGAIVNFGGSSGLLSAPAISLAAATGIGSKAAPLFVAGASGLTATNSGAGDIALAQATGNVTVGTGGWQLSNAGGDYVVGGEDLTLTLNSGAPSSGDMFVGARDIVVASSGYINSGIVSLTALNDVNVNGGLSANDLGLFAGNAVNINGATASATETVSVQASALNITAGSAPARLAAGTDTGIVAGEINLQGGSGAGAFAELKGGPGAMDVVTLAGVATSGDIVLKGGSGSGAYARIYGDPDVGSLEAPVSVGGVIRMTAGTGSGAYARIESASASSIHVDFAGVASGGYFVNGVESTVASGDSGFFAGGQPAVLNQNLIVTYGGQPPIEVIEPLPGGLEQTLTGGVDQAINQVVALTDQQTDLTGGNVGEGTGNGIGTGNGGGTGAGGTTDEKKKKQLPICTK